jgi:hypothetical protein
MKITDREMAIVSTYSAIRSRRRTGAWLGLAIVVALWIAIAYTERLDSLGTVLGIFLGLLVAELASLYFGIRPEDKLIDLLQRYINQDAEALKQFSSKRNSQDITV